MIELVFLKTDISNGVTKKELSLRDLLRFYYWF